MDLRTGKIYATREAALADGVPESDLAMVEPPRAPGDAPTVTVTKGPFKGRIYRRTEHGLVRVGGKR